MRKILNFLNDEDGFSAKDYLMVTFGTIFLLMVVTAFIVSLVGTLPPTTISVIGLMDGVIITIVGGVFGIQGIQAVMNRKSTQSTNESNDSTYTEVEPERKDEYVNVRLP